MSAGSMTTRATPKPPTVDLTNSATDAFLAFNEFHERLNFSLKSNVVSLLATEQDITAGTRSIADLKEASFLNKRLWGGMPAWGNAARALEGLSLAQHDAASAAIVRAFSAFDLFLESQFFFLHTHEGHLVRHWPVQLFVDEMFEMSMFVAQAVDVLLNGHCLGTLPRSSDRH